MVWDCTEFKMCRDRTSSSLVHLLSLSLVQYNCLNAIVPYPIHMLFREWLKHPVNLRQKFIINSQLTGSEVCTPRLANQIMWHFREKETLCTNFKVIRQISRVLRNFHFQTLCSIKGCTVLSTDFSPIWPIDNLMLLKAQQNSTSYMQQYAKNVKNDKHFTTWWCKIILSHCIQKQRHTNRMWSLRVSSISVIGNKSFFLTDSHSMIEKDQQ